MDRKKIEKLLDDALAACDLAMDYVNNASENVQDALELIEKESDQEEQKNDTD